MSGPVVIWTDGGCIGNGDASAIGSWAIVCSNGHEEYGTLEGTTNNRAELMAVLHAMRYAETIGAPSPIIRTDSMLTVKCAKGQWRRRANRDLWSDYDSAARRVRPVMEWVRGHASDPGNVRADELCTIAMRRRWPNWRDFSGRGSR